MRADRPQPSGAFVSVISMGLHMALPTECHRNEVRNMVNIIYFLWKRHGFSNYKSTVTNIGEGNGTPLQYSCLENPMDRGAWWAAVHGVKRKHPGEPREQHILILAISTSPPHKQPQVKDRCNRHLSFNSFPLDWLYAHQASF